MKRAKTASLITSICCLINTYSANAQASQIKHEIPSAFVSVGKAHGVPPKILYALAKQETNTKMASGKMMPWPFAINFKGKPYLFKTEREMCDFAKKLISAGKESVDIGITQQNYKWQKHRVSSIDEMCNTIRNLHLGAELIAKYHKKTGNWITAAGMYHNPANRNGAADRYKKQFSRHLADLN